MNIEGDINKLKSCIRLHGLPLGININDAHLSNVTKNVLITLFKPYSSHLGQNFYYLYSEQLKIVVDILELMGD